MGINDTKKRLILAALVLIGIISVLAAWLTYQSNRPYQVKTIADTELYIPVEYLEQKPKDLLTMVRSYIQGHSPQLRIQIPTVELLNDTLNENENVIVTIEPTEEAPKVSLLPLTDITLLKAALNETKIPTERQNNGLLKIYGNKSDKNAFSFSNINTGTETLSADVWLAHCIHFRSLRADSSWGRCSRQIIQSPLKISFHFNGDLVPETAMLSSAILEKIQTWLMPPQS